MGLLNGRYSAECHGRGRRENRATREQRDNELASMTQELRRMAVMRDTCPYRQPCVKRSFRERQVLFGKRVLLDTAKYRDPAISTRRTLPAFNCVFAACYFGFADN